MLNNYRQAKEGREERERKGREGKERGDGGGVRSRKRMKTYITGNTAN